MAQVGNHFLCVLFPGLGDFPPPYAAQPPESFDTQLPDIRPSDVKALGDLLPELAFLLNVPEVAPLPGLRDSGIQQEAAEEPQKMSVGDVTSSNLVKSSSVPNDKCATKGPCLSESGASKANPNEEAPEATSPDDRDPEESEPDTEEFETLEGGTADVVPFQEVSEVRTSRSVLGTSSSSPGVAPSHSPIPSLAPLSRSEGQCPLSPEDLCADHSSSLPDFLTADFYIDESMPSSYTESSYTTGTVGYGRGHAVKGHHVIVAELQRRLEEKGAAIVELQVPSVDGRSRQVP